MDKSNRYLGHTMNCAPEELLDLYGVKDTICGYLTGHFPLAPGGWDYSLGSTYKYNQTGTDSVPT